jgi:hypothetical protein
MRSIGWLVVLMATMVTLEVPHAFADAAVSAEPSSNAEPYANCAAVGNIRFVCLSTDPEDIARLPGTDWVVTSAFSGSVGLRLVSIGRRKEVATLYPSTEAKKKQDMAAYSSCPGPLSAEDEATFIAHGIALKAVTAHSFTLYVVHHGSRESIEIFNLDVPSGKRPLVTWVGCAVYPNGALGNAVAPLPDGGFVVTKFGDRLDSWKVPVNVFTREIFGDPMIGSRERTAAAAEQTGYDLEWHPGSGWARIPGSDGVGNNGIEASKDGKYVYTVVGGTLLRTSRGENPPRRDEASLGIRGDNVKWTTDGKKLLVGGGPLGAGDPGRNEGKVVEVDPDTLQVTDLLDSPVATITTAYQIGNDLWLVSGSISRITIIPMPGR